MTDSDRSARFRPSALRTLVVVPVALGALLLAGCSGSSGNNGPSTGPTGTAPASTGATSTAPTGGSSGTVHKAPSLVMRYQHVTNKQSNQMQKQITGVRGVATTLYYQDTKVFEVHLTKQATKLDRKIINSLVLQDLQKK